MKESEAAWLKIKESEIKLECVRLAVTVACSGNGAAAAKSSKKSMSAESIVKDAEKIYAFCE